ncbi:hypothetical protein FNF31_00524 [Cafeteria roenbergensis]|uniref:Uncharacterized protein n=1 Tax=Cafeteria roenbergensis TaxID=33653 RepID=A0A5A8DR99_CAFRO|nr:hypothetical protein FNF31_00524 [Cafeteria roenbergensis]
MAAGSTGGTAAGARAGVLAVPNAAESAWAAERAAVAHLSTARSPEATDADREAALHAALLTRGYLQRAADRGDGGADALAALAALSATPEVRAYDSGRGGSGPSVDRGGVGGAGRETWSLDVELLGSPGSGGSGGGGTFVRRGRALAADVDDLVCSGVGLPASSNSTYQQCNGTRVTPAVLAAVTALQAAATAEAGDAVLTALEGALLALPGFNVSTLIPRGTPIPAGVNLSALPEATQSALLEAANVSSLANITSFDQVIGEDGSIAGGRLNAADLLPLLPVNATLDLVQSLRCSEASELLDACACPLDFRGESCGSRRSLVVSMEVDDPAVRACLETPAEAPLGPGGVPFSPGAFGFNGASLLNSGLPPCLFFAREARTGLPDHVQLPLTVAVRFHPDDRPEGWFCNGTLLTRERADAILRASGSSTASSAEGAPWFGINCVERSFEYVLGPSLDAAASSNPGLQLAARAWSFDALSDDRFAQAVDVLDGSVVPTPWVASDRGPAVGSSLPAPAEGVRFARRGPALPPGPAPAVSQWLVTVPAAALPAQFRPAGRAHFEAAVFQALPSPEQDAAYPQTVEVSASAPYSDVPAGAPRPPLSPGRYPSVRSRLERVPPLPVRRPFPLLAVALDDADWVPAEPSADVQAIVGWAVGLSVAALAAVAGVLWWLGRCGVAEEAVGASGWLARADIVKGRAAAQSSREPARARGRTEDEGAFQELELASMPPSHSTE